MEGDDESVHAECAFISVGCNRVVNAVAWGPSNLVAFGAHHSVGIFDPAEARILVTLPGHVDYVNCVQWIPAYQKITSTDGHQSNEQFLLSGSSDGGLIMWRCLAAEKKWAIVVNASKNAHTKAVTCIAALRVSPSAALVSTTSSDSFVRVWNVSLTSGDCCLSELQSISVSSRVMVATSLTLLPGSQETILLALGGLDNHVYLHVGSTAGQFNLVSQVKGHQDWIRALDFSPLSCHIQNGEVFLASCSQDKTVRLWKISRRDEQAGERMGTLERSLKTFIDGPVFRAAGHIWQVSVESLLLGHEDWVFSVRWQPCRLDGEAELEKVYIDGQMQKTRERMSILSASMDRTMMVWRPDATSGIWTNEVMVGELGQSALGFYGGVWSPDGDAILANGFSGSFHLWKNESDCDRIENWQPRLVPSGHSASVQDLAWAKTGQFLLSVSHDQTARLFASWNWDKTSQGTSKKNSWHEIGRPQVHGHDFNCLAAVQGGGNHRYVSGAEEKVARVFEAPGALLDTLDFACGGKSADKIKRDDVQIVGANMSALGLSQKPIFAQGRISGAETNLMQSHEGDVGLDGMNAVPDAVPVALTEPPLEEHLAQNTLWPELHKLYGHGNELFAMCSDHTGTLLATACKAQSAAFAQIWLWQVNTWRPVCQLQSHVLTVTQMEFSHNDKFLLSVSRDRHLSVFEVGRPDDESKLPVTYKLLARVEAHKRIIWTCSWSSCDRFFATGSRDKTVKIWKMDVDDRGTIRICNIQTIPPFVSSVTALAWGPEYLLAVGMESGALELWGGGDGGNGEPCDDKHSGGHIESVRMMRLLKFDSFLSHGAAVNRLAWKWTGGRHESEEDDENISEEKHFRMTQVLQLATCGADCSVRLYDITTCRRVVAR